VRIDGDDMVVSYDGEHKDRMIENCYGKQKPTKRYFNKGSIKCSRSIAYAASKAKKLTRDVHTIQQFRMIIRKSLEQSNSNQQKSVERWIVKE
jgi:hypothetical protein